MEQHRNVLLRQEEICGGMCALVVFLLKQHSNNAKHVI